MKDFIKISPDKIRASALKEMARERYSSVDDLKKPYRILEEYYEIIKELLTAFMYNEGFKTLSHKLLIDFARDKMSFLTVSEIELIDDLRIKRNNIVYYGERVTTDFLKYREPKIKKIIDCLIKNLVI